MLFWIIILIEFFFYQLTTAVPVPSNSNLADDLGQIEFFDDLNKHDYSEYMNDVLKELQTDSKFLKEIEKNDGTDSIEQYATYLNAASDNARNKLDEIKQREIVRLNTLEKELQKIHELKDSSYIDKQRSHISSTSDSRFTEEDLKALISKAKHDIDMVDKVAEVQYRRNQMRKRIKERRQLRKTKDPEERKKLKEKFSEARKKRNAHLKVHEPGSQQQLKEVWSDQDNLDPESFDSNTFFRLHDLNQDNHWDISEVEALLQTDVEKAYHVDGVPVDRQEKFHEAMKMRQRMMAKMDANKDQLISLEEFLQFEKSADFKEDHEWKTTEEVHEPMETDEELDKYNDEIKKFLESYPAHVDINTAQSEHPINF